MTKKETAEKPEIEETEIPAVAEAVTETATESPAVEEAAPKKRGRGRPPKNPGERAAESTTASGPKRRAKSASGFDRAALARQLVGIHQVAAMVSGIPEVVISEPEGDALAGGVIAVCEEYGLSLGGKTGAAIQLAAAAAMIYGPRLFAINQRLRAERAKDVTDYGENQPAH